jgi:hypothetical protein
MPASTPSATVHRSRASAAATSLRASTGPAFLCYGEEHLRLSIQVSYSVGKGVRAPVRWFGDLAAERAAFGPGRVAHAPMQDHGRPQRPAAWAAVACFAAGC